MHVDTDVLMEYASLQAHGLAEPEFHDLTNVRITKRVSTHEHSLPNTLELTEHPNFSDITYSTLDHDCCDLLIMTDHIQLLVCYSLVKELNSIAFPEP